LKKHDVWKTIGKFASYRSVAATFVLALTAALVGGFLNSAQEGIFVRAIIYAVATGALCAILSGNPVLFATGAVFTFTGIMQSPICPESMLVLSKDCLNNTNIFGAFDWLLGTPSPSWTEQSTWSHDMIDLTLRGLMWTIPLGLPIRSYSYSSLVSFSGLAMGFAYQAGNSKIVPFPLCLMGLSPGMTLGDFYMGAWLFFAITVCLLGSNHRLPPVEVNETVAPAIMAKPVPVVVEFQTQENEKEFMKTRVLDTDTETDEEPLVVATVIGHPVSSPTTSSSKSTAVVANTNIRKLGRCGRPVHGSRAMQCCWATHFFLGIYLTCLVVFVLCTWWSYSPEIEAVEKVDSDSDDDDWFFGWDSWYLWIILFFLFSYSYRKRRRGGRRACCCGRNFSGQ